MTIRIQQTTEGHCTILRLSGELVSSQREALLEEIEGNNTVALDLERVAEGYEQMSSGKVRFRVVLTM